MNIGFLEADYIFDLTEWGIGINTGKTMYSNWKFYASIDLLCFCFVIWFGRKQPNFTTNL